MSITVTTQISGHVAEIRFAKPPLNFACPELLRKIADELDVIDRNADIRCSVLASDGKSFCAGADLAGNLGGDGNGHDCKTFCQFGAAARHRRRALDKRAVISKPRRNLPRRLLVALVANCAAG